MEELHFDASLLQPYSARKRRQGIQPSEAIKPLFIDKKSKLLF